MTPDPTVTFLTQDAYDRLSTELETLSTSGRDDIVRRIEAAREEGDLKENGGYHAAKDQQGVLEARIRQLTGLLRTAQVGSAATGSGRVEPGTMITATIAGDDSTFLLGNREIAAGTDYTVYSEQSPLGSAILDLAVGDSTSYTAPNGKEIAVTIVKVEPFAG